MNLRSKEKTRRIALPLAVSGLLGPLVVSCGDDKPPNLSSSYELSQGLATANIGDGANVYRVIEGRTILGSMDEEMVYINEGLLDCDDRVDSPAQAVSFDPSSRIAMLLARDVALRLETDMDEICAGYQTVSESVESVFEQENFVGG